MQTTHPIKLSPETFRHERAADIWSNVAVLGVFCIGFSILRWCTLESFWGDSPRWILEAYRGSAGELVYRDFAWQYPPLALLLFSGAFRIFGQTFATAAIVLDVISTAVVLLTWDVGRRLLPRPLPVLVAIALTCAGSSNISNFALFSLEIYTPAMILGMVGLLLVVRETIDYLRSGRSRLVWLSIGSTIGLLSKPEFIAGVVGCLAALVIADLRIYFHERPKPEWMRHYAKIAAAVFAPAAAVYLVLAAICGLGNLLAGIGGYGEARLACPWWPTGLGLFGGAVALGQAAIIAAAISLFQFKTLRNRYGRGYNWLWIAAAAGAALTALYLPDAAREIPVLKGRVTPAHLLEYFSSTGTVLLPVMWIAIVLWFVLAGRLFRVSRDRTRWTSADGIVFAIVSAGFFMSLRGLFNGTMSQLSLAASAAYPLWFILGPYFLLRFLNHGVANASPAVVVLVAGFALLRLGGTLAGEWRQTYARIATPAGTVRVKDLSISRQVRDYVADHTGPADFVLDLGAGGLNFTERRPSPIFSTQFTSLAPARRYLALDLATIQRHPPRLVVANEGRDFQAAYGVCMNTGCVFPRLVWRPDRLACDPDADFPVLDYIRANYTPTAAFGGKIIYSPR